jgi:transposase
VNILKEHLRITIETLHRHGASQHEIARRIGVDRKTIRNYTRKVNSSGVATGSTNIKGLSAGTHQRSPAAGACSACEAHRAWIEAQVQQGRNAQSIYQDLVEKYAFAHRYNSVKRFVRTLKRIDPQRFDVLECEPGEEAQVDFGQGALTMHSSGKYRRPLLFVMTLKYSGKSFRRVVWKGNQQVWAQLHEQAFRKFGGSVRYVVLDNLKQGVSRADLYEPELNPVYTALLAHYSAVADTCRVRDPNRKGTVESAIRHTQDTALKGRKFQSIEEQNAFLDHWEERWAAPRIHGRKKRQVMKMFVEEERPRLQPLPLDSFRFFKHGSRIVDDSGLVQIEGSYYTALPAALHSQVNVRIYEDEIEILGPTGEVLRRHEKRKHQGEFCIPKADRLFNPSRETARLVDEMNKIGTHTAALARIIFEKRGRPGQRLIYALAQLSRTHQRDDIEAVCAHVLANGTASYRNIKRALEQRAAAAVESQAPMQLVQADRTPSALRSACARSE